RDHRQGHSGRLMPKARRAWNRCHSKPLEQRCRSRHGFDIFSRHDQLLGRRHAFRRMLQCMIEKALQASPVMSICAHEGQLFKSILGEGRLMNAFHAAPKKHLLTTALLLALVPPLAVQSAAAQETTEEGQAAAK